MSDPCTACFRARFALEGMVNWLYAHDDTLQNPYETTLSARIHEPTFRALVGDALVIKARIIKDLGNKAVHETKPVAPSAAITALRELFHVAYRENQPAARAIEVDGRAQAPGQAGPVRRFAAGDGAPEIILTCGYFRASYGSAVDLFGPLTATFGRPPMDVLRELRLRQAAVQLQVQHLAVDTIAHGAGYASTSSFVRAFKRQHGVDPSEYRTAAQGTRP